MSRRKARELGCGRSSSIKYMDVPKCLFYQTPHWCYNFNKSNEDKKKRNPNIELASSPKNPKLPAQYVGTHSITTSNFKAASTVTYSSKGQLFVNPCLSTRSSATSYEVFNFLRLPHESTMHVVAQVVDLNTCRKREIFSPTIERDCFN